MESMTTTRTGIMVVALLRLTWSSRCGPCIHTKSRKENRSTLVILVPLVHTHQLATEMQQAHDSRAPDTARLPFPATHLRLPTSFRRSRTYHQKAKVSQRSTVDIMTGF